ncbi:MAG: AraC family transcriptional regulator [Acidobacteriota bacterium]|nr:AraC family transcriptional regulator [Acidobacteriota bacterium]MDQ7086831.1 AraC family transcriptional regulator [Acidobacteriota bacterium]
MTSSERLGADAVNPGDPQLWISSHPALTALEKMDLQAFDEGVEQLLSSLGQLSTFALPPVLLFHYDLLRSVAERLSLDGRPPAEEQRLIWINTLGAFDTAASAANYVRGEIARMVEPFHDARSRINPIVVRARRYIEEHANERISLSRVASAVGVARNYLSSLFRKECGITLTEYIHQVRIDKARRLLQRDGGSLGEVAEQVGYQNYRHFYRSFLRVCSVSPTTYLKSLRARVDSSPPASGGGIAFSALRDSGSQAPPPGA